MKGWKYVGRHKVVILAKKDDFTGVPVDIVADVAGVTGQPWGDRPGNPLPDKLIGADKATIEAALKQFGWYSN